MPALLMTDVNDAYCFKWYFFIEASTHALILQIGQQMCDNHLVASIKLVTVHGPNPRQELTRMSRLLLSFSEF